MDVDAVIFTDLSDRLFGDFRTDITLKSYPEIGARDGPESNEFCALDLLSKLSMPTSSVSLL